MKFHIETVGAWRNERTEMEESIIPIPGGGILIGQILCVNLEFPVLEFHTCTQVDQVEAATSEFSARRLVGHVCKGIAAMRIVCADKSLGTGLSNGEGLGDRSIEEAFCGYRRCANRLASTSLLECLTGAQFTALADIESIANEDRSGSINYTVGFFYRDADRTVELTGGIPFVDTSIEQWSFFGQLYWDITEELSATFGMRYGEFKSAVTDTLNGLPTAKNKFEDVSPKVALNWTPSDNTMSYISIAKGFRAGGANVDVSLGTDPSFSQGFDSDEIWNYEIGLKKIFMDGRVSLNTALFYIDWKDIQIDKPVTNVINPPQSFIVVNGEGAHSYGIEVDLYWNPAEGWDIVLGGSVLEAQFDGGFIDSPFGLFALDGMTLPSAPEVRHSHL